MKLLKKLVIAFVLIYVITLGLVYVDVYDSRPIVNLFKNFQTDSSLKIVDFSVENNQLMKDLNLLQIKTEILITVICMFILNIHLMRMFLE